MSTSNINYFDLDTWDTSVAHVLMGAVVRACQEQGTCTVMLTGGRSAERLYRAWAKLPSFAQLRDVRFFFGDERCVPPDHPESNYGLVMRSLFQYGIPHGCAVIRMEADSSDHEAAALSYAQKLPERIDILLLSMGEDGHIASLFPHSTALLETNKWVIPVCALKPPAQRLTVTPPLIARAAQVFVMALGPQKTMVFKQALTEPENVFALPARLVLGASWFLNIDLSN